MSPGLVSCMQIFWSLLNFMVFVVPYTKANSALSIGSLVWFSCWLLILIVIGNFKKEI